ncbi:MAG: hypothetical protein K0Q54_4767, partial [Methylobacterium brachiatum]|nr:hypothetical protein [Methylobacterium brachiatum]
MPIGAGNPDGPVNPNPTLDQHWETMAASRTADSDQPRRPTMKILIVLTSHDRLGDTGA